MTNPNNPFQSTNCAKVWKINFCVGEKYKLMMHKSSMILIVHERSKRLMRCFQAHIKNNILTVTFTNNIRTPILIQTILFWSEIYDKFWKINFCVGEKYKLMMHKIVSEFDCPWALQEAYALLSSPPKK